MSKSAGREGVRLWFEFVKRAHADKTVHVNEAFYKPWGDYPNQTFNEWWQQHAETLFPRNKVEIVQRYLSDDGVLNVSVPMALTPTEAAAQLRHVLMEHYQAIGHTPKPHRAYALTEGAEIKVSALRAYLATYDANQTLSAALQVQRVPAKLLLAEVRRVYMARSHRWIHTKRKVEGLPMALAGEIHYDAKNDQVTSTGDDTGAERAVRRYLAIADNLVAAAAAGDFPSRNYFKV